MNVKTKSRYPVSLNEVKQHLRIDLTNNEDDNYITNFIIKSATQKAENFIDKDIAYTTNVYTINDFNGSYLKVLEGNLISLDHIISDSSTLLTYETLYTNEDNFEIDFGSTVDSEPLILQFTSGYDPDDCPEPIKQAILIECGNLFDMERSSYSLSNIKKSDVFERMLMSYKTVRW